MELGVWERDGVLCQDEDQRPSGGRKGVGGSGFLFLSLKGPPRIELKWALRFSVRG